MAPIVRGRKGEFKKEMEKLVQHGFTRARVDGELVNLEDEIALDKRKNHTIEVVVDRLLVKPGIEHRLEMSVGAGDETGRRPGPGRRRRRRTRRSTPRRLACPDCGINVPQLEPRSFSFNSAYGACPECHGLGSNYDFDPAKIIIDWSKPLLDGGLGPGSGSQNLQHMVQLAAAALRFRPQARLSRNFPRRFRTCCSTAKPARGGKTGFQGILGYLKQSLEESTSDSYREWLLDFMSATDCPACHGKRLRPESLAVKVNGMSIADFTGLSARALARSRAKDQASPGAKNSSPDRIMREIVERLEFLNAVGLGYISLDRSAATLSGGEGQRIRLATQIGSRLRGVLYVLDEPSIGLHHRDNDRLSPRSKTCATSATPSSSSSMTKKPSAAPTTSSTSAPAPAATAATSSPTARPHDIMQAPDSLTGAYISGEVQIEMRRRSAAIPTAMRSPSWARAKTTSRISTSPSRSA